MGQRLEREADTILVCLRVCTAWRGSGLSERPDGLQWCHRAPPFRPFQEREGKAAFGSGHCVARHGHPQSCVVVAIELMMCLPITVLHSSRMLGVPRDCTQPFDQPVVGYKKTPLKDAVNALSKA